MEVVIMLTRERHILANKWYVHDYEKINRICENVLHAQHQPKACASDLGDDSHITCWSLVENRSYETTSKNYQDL